MIVRQVLSPIAVRLDPSTVKVTISTTPPLTIRVAAQGPAGPQGSTGIQGPIGNSPTTIVSQSTPSTLWTIVHNLGKFPSVVTVDTTNRLIEGEVEYVNANSLTVAFNVAEAGSAYLN